MKIMLGISGSLLGVVLALVFHEVFGSSRGEFACLSGAFGSLFSFAILMSYDYMVGE